MSTRFVKFKGVDDRTSFYIDPRNVDAIQTIDSIKTNLVLSTDDKDVVIIRTSNNFSFATSESIDEVLKKLDVDNE